MLLPKRPPFDPRGKTAPLHQSGSHPVARSAAASLRNVAKPLKVGPGQSWANLTKDDVDEYARSRAGGGACANPGPGLLEKLSGRIKGLFKKAAKSP
jgi:hypothetical protein